MKVTIIGIDCATDPTKVGLALGAWSGGRAKIWDVVLGGREEPLAQVVTNWLARDMPILIALDAPLGWPAKLGSQLEHHSAGEPIGIAPNKLFRRETDQGVKEKLGRQPLDVGADRIARTAHATLHLLGEIRRISGYPIPLAWHPEVEGVSAIEVYPAATLMAYGIQSSGYKKKGQADSREEIVERLCTLLDLPDDTSLILSNADALDSAVCVLAAADFLNGRAVQPSDIATAKKEGWIWFYPG
jgi:predicted nuclease with RNAse H fold